MRNFLLNLIGICASIPLVIIGFPLLIIYEFIYLVIWLLFNFIKWPHEFFKFYINENKND